MWLDTGPPVDGAAPGVPLSLHRRCGASSAQRRPLRPREGFALYTDSLEDVLGPGRERFGTARVTQALSGRLRGATPQEIVDGLKHAACAFGGGALYATSSSPHYGSHSRGRTSPRPRNTKVMP